VPRALAVLSTPDRWPVWPLLPLIRHQAGGEYDCGLVYDFPGTGGPPGLACTVWLTNLFTLPETLDAFLALPHETFDTFEELLGAGWRVD
jgi:hypothetical protein